MLTVVVRPGVDFAADVPKLVAVLSKACEGRGYSDGKVCEVGAPGLGHVLAKCWKHFCCPGCWDGTTCRLTITSNTRNSSVDDVACGSYGGLCSACSAPQVCGQREYPGDVVATLCQG